MTVRMTSDAAARRPTPRAGAKAAATIAVAGALLGAVAHAAAPTAGSDASGTVAASAPAAVSQAVPFAGGQYQVKPGQSLNDVAADVMQSHDRSVVHHASKAVFDANPDAFFSSDPSRMKLGAVLNVPPLDATGHLAGSEAAVAGAASGAEPASAAAGLAASAAATPGAGAAASGAAQASGASSAAVAAAAAEQAASHAGAAGTQPASGATGGQGWTGAIQPGASAPVGAAANEAGASEASTTPAPSTTSSATSAAQPHVSSLQQLLALKNRVLMALQQHGFGSAQPEAGNRQAAGKAQSAAGSQRSGPETSNIDSGAAPAAAPAGGSTAAPAPQADAAAFSVNGWQINIGALSAAVAALLVLVVGLVMRSRKRAAAAAAADRGEAHASTAADAAAETPAPGAQAPAEQGADAPGADAAMAGQGREASSGTVVLSADDAAEADFLATLAQSPNSKSALMGLITLYAELRDVARFDGIAQRIWHLSGGRGPNWRHVASLGRQLAPHNPLYAEGAGGSATALGAHEASETDTSAQVEPTETLGETGAASAAALAEGESTAKGVTESDEAGERVESPGSQSGEQTQSNAGELPATASDERASSAEADWLRAEDAAAHAEESASHEKEASAEAGSPTPDAVSPADATVPPAQGHALPAADAEPAAAEPARASEPADLTPAASQATDVTAPTVAGAQVASEATQSEDRLENPTPQPAREPVASLEDDSDEEHVPVARDEHGMLVPPPLHFPTDAISALSSLDFSLPPRLDPIEPFAQTHAPDGLAVPPLLLATQPVVTPEIAGKQAMPPFEAKPQRAGEAIEAGIAGPASVAGLGAARFGALSLDFDLDLPASASAPPLPTFTPDQLARIARNKLDLAAEYIELGDLGGARTLINEVIESNDAATRNEARAMLATLAPLS